MFEDLRSVKLDERARKVKACTSRACKESIRAEGKSEKNQQNQEGLLCKINLC